MAISDTTARDSGQGTDLETKLLQLIDAGVKQGNDRIFNAAQQSVAVGTPLVLDVRGARGFTVYLNGGTATYQPCDSGGTVVPGSASTASTSGTGVSAVWPFYKIVATTATCTVGQY